MVKRDVVTIWQSAKIRGSWGFASESLHQGWINPVVVFGKARRRKIIFGKTERRWHALPVRKAATVCQERQPKGYRAGAHPCVNVSRVYSCSPGTRVLGRGRGHKDTRNRRMRPTTKAVAAPVEVCTVDVMTEVVWR